MKQQVKGNTPPVETLARPDSCSKQLELEGGRPYIQRKTIKISIRYQGRNRDNPDEEESKDAVQPSQSRYPTRCRTNDYRVFTNLREKERLYKKKETMATTVF